MKAGSSASASRRRRCRSGPGRRRGAERVAVRGDLGSGRPSRSRRGGRPRPEMFARCVRRRRGPAPPPAGPGRRPADGLRPRRRPSRCATRHRGAGPAETVVSSKVNASVAQAAARLVIFARGGTSSCRSVNTATGRPVHGSATAGPATPPAPALRNTERPPRCAGDGRARPRRPRTRGSRRHQRRTPPSARTGTARAPPSGRACQARRTRHRCESTRTRRRRTYSDPCRGLHKVGQLGRSRS